MQTKQRMTTNEALFFRASKISLIANGLVRFGLTAKQREEMENLEVLKVTPPGLTEKQQESYNVLLVKHKAGDELTAKQLKDFESYKDKLTKPRGLTDVQASRLQRLKEDNAKKPELSKGAKTYIKQVWLQNERSYREEISNKYLNKGRQAEEDSITLITKVDKIFYIKNKEPKFKGFISGCCDINTHFKDIDLRVIDDTKSSWSPLTFMKAEFTSDYEWQGRAYMHLYDADIFRLRYCLVDCPPDIYEHERYLFCLQNNIIDDSMQEYQDLLLQFDRNMIYSKPLGKLMSYEQKELDELESIAEPTANECFRISQLKALRDQPLYSEEERVKTFQIKRDYELESIMIQASQLAAEYYDTISLNMVDA